MRWVWVLVLLGVVVLGAVAWITLLSDFSKNCIKTATIVDWYPEKEGLVLTVCIDGKFYKLYTNASFINVNKSVNVIFRNGIPIAILQGYRLYKVLNWEELKNLESMPKVVKQQ